MSRCVSGLGRVLLAATLSASVWLVAAAPAHAGTLLSTNVSASQAVERTCFARDLSSGAGFASRNVTSPALGFIQARLLAPGGDWDLGVFDAETGRTVAGSAHFRSRELAEGVVGKGQRLVVQACRLSGATSTARLNVEVDEIDVGASLEKTQLVHVSTPTRAQEAKLTSLGLDMTEHGRKGFLGVVLHGADDARKLRQAGFSYDVVIDDLGAQSVADRRADHAFARSVTKSALPSGRNTYRRLFHYTNEMKLLARRFPNIVTPITLYHPTYEGRPVEGIEITTPRNPLRKPVFLQMGVHHAREWPSGEHAMEWAYQLINGFRNGLPRVERLVRSTRTVIIPIVNPDGFNISRESGEAQGGGGGRGGNETQNIVGHPFEYRRKNCRFVNDAPAGSCTQPSVGLAEPGVDPNRNYGGFWGGDGSSSDPTAQDYRGPGPFSEPETKNIRGLISTRHVTALITNHTYSNLVLRPPGVASLGQTIDEPIYKALGDAMAAENGYKSQFGYQLYDTTGTTEDWSYYTTGGLGYTFEIGPTNFHPPFAEVVAEYEGTTPAAGAGAGNREAYFKAQEFAANPARHSVISGIGPQGAVLRLYKTVLTPTSQENPDGTRRSVVDRLSTKIWLLPQRFEWHVNPSTRPLVAPSGRDAHGEPSPRRTFNGSAGASAQPCGDFDTEDPACFNDHPFQVPSGPGIDNAKVTVRIEWATLASDWDMKVFRDTNGDGSSVGETDPVGSSAQGNTDNEQTTIGEPILTPGRYVARVINFAAAEPYDGTITFRGPDPFQPGRKESWTLACENPEGTVRTTRQVTVDRGQRVNLDLRSSCRRP
jgi:hypothetical protein